MSMLYTVQGNITFGQALGLPGFALLSKDDDYLITSQYSDEYFGSEIVLYVAFLY